jgi:ABC-type amino acid transport substrate-binding protein
MKKQAFLFFASLLLLFCVHAAPAKTVRVGVIDSMPFSGKLTNGKFDGFVVDFWKEIALENNWKTQFVDAGTDITAAMKKFKTGQYQVLLGPIEANHKNHKLSSFSRPLYISYIVLLSSHSQDRFFKILHDLLSIFFNKVFIIVFLTLAILSLFGYLLQKKLTHSIKEEKSFLFQIWHILVIFLTMHQYAKFRHFSSRIMYTIIIVLSIATLTSFTATVTSALTHSYKHNILELKTKQNLNNQIIAIVKGQFDPNYITQAGGKVFITKSLTQALTLLKEKKVDAIASYYPLIQYAIDTPTYRNKFHILPYGIGLKEIVMAFPKKSPLLDATDVSIIKLRDSLKLYEKCIMHLPKSDSQSCAL